MSAPGSSPDTVGPVVVGDPLGDPVPPSLARYYAAIDGGRFDEAVAQFTDDCLYAVPPAGIETLPRALTAGADTLRERFEARGMLAHAHTSSSSPRWRMTSA